MKITVVLPNGPFADEEDAEERKARPRRPNRRTRTPKLRGRRR